MLVSLWSLLSPPEATSSLFKFFIKLTLGFTVKCVILFATFSYVSPISHFVVLVTLLLNFSTLFLISKMHEWKTNATKQNVPVCKICFVHHWHNNEKQRGI